MALDPYWIDKIRQFEGFHAKPYWDARQWSVGYGTKASGPDDVVDQAEAERRLSSEIGEAAGYVDKFAPGLDPGTRAALVSLTYNAGPSWMQSGLGQAVKSGDMAAARDRFLKYTKSEGQTLRGLVNRRNAEAQWFGQAGQSSPVQSSAPQSSPVEALASLIGGQGGGDGAPMGFPAPAQEQQGPTASDKLMQSALESVSDTPEFSAGGGRINPIRIRQAVRGRLGLTGV